jgi:hypothetical protein
MPHKDPLKFHENYPEDIPDLLPHWAIGTTNGELVLGAQLPTRDGRRCGNAHIVDITPPTDWSQGSCIYTVLTDAGTQLKLTAAEIVRLYYQPRWVSDVNEVLHKFKDRDQPSLR